MTLDDTYVVKGDLRGFLSEVRGDQFSDSFSLLIKSGDSEYYSNRIIKSHSGLRYKYTIHEVIPKEDNVNVTVPVDRAFILDERSDYMENRTTSRKQFDLELLFKELEENPDDPRSLYYIAQTYGCMGDEVNKAKYLEMRVNHHEEGYIQEKVDACFELARSCNFQLGKEWSVSEKWYERAHELDPERPDSLYFLGIHWHMERNYARAYEYFKKGFEVGYPLHRQYSLKPTLSFHFLPRFLTEVCYYVKDFALGENAARFFIQNNPPGSNSLNLVHSWFGIHTELNKMGPISTSPRVLPGKVFCIVADGGWSDWNGRNIHTSGVGGSETWVIEIARNLKKNNPGVIVLVFCKCKEPEDVEGVGYNPIQLFHGFVANNVVDVCIVSRYTQYVPVAIRGHVKEIGIIFHDLIQDETVIPIDPKVKWAFGLTDWHSRYIRNFFPHLNVQTLNYGVSSKFVSGNKIRNSFVYSSFPNRGLVVLLKMWPKIHQKFPGAVLNLYCNVDGDWVNKVAPDEMCEVRRLLQETRGVLYHGWVSKETLARAWETAEYWLYPCKFEETFCLTALEAAVSRTLAVTNNLAALEDTVGDRGVITHGNPLEEAWQDECLAKLFRYMDGTLEKSLLLEKNFQWAQTLTWEGQAKKLSDFTGLLEYRGMLNWTVDSGRQDILGVLKKLSQGSNILEVGTFVGTSLVGFLENTVGTHATVIDSWTPYPEKNQNEDTIVTKVDFSDIEKTFYKNTEKYKNRIKVLKGSSREKLLELVVEQKQFDFIYIDGSHKCLDVYLDACLAWKLLKPGGYIVFDDYLFNTGDLLGSPKEAIDHFMREHRGTVVFKYYRVCIKSD